MNARRWFGIAAVVLMGCVCRGSETLLLEGWTFEKDGKSETVRIPHDWAIAGPFDRSNDAQEVQVWDDNETEPQLREGRTGALPVVGKGIYRRAFTIPEGTGFASFVFDGVMSDSEIFVDGTKLAERHNGYAIFEVEVPPVAGKHELEVRVSVPPQNSRWYQGGGLYRPVRFITAGATGLKTHGIYARTSYLVGDTARVAVTTDLRLSAADLKEVKATETLLKDPNELPPIGNRLHVRHRLLDRNGREVAAGAKAPVSHGKTAIMLDVKSPQLWSPEEPNLYTLVTEVVRGEVVLDSNSQRIGIRTISYAPDGFRLNGKVRKFQGVNLHHDLGPLGAAFNRSAFRRQVRLLKEMGVDSIRTAHNFPPPWQTEICDELGMMVMAESLDEWLRPKCLNGYHLHFAEWWERDFTDSYRAVINSPSIVMWAIGNEVHDQRRESGYYAAKGMIDLCHRLDPSRPVAAGLSWLNNSIESQLLSLFDVPAYTYHLHRYDDIRANTPQGFVVGAESSNTISSRGIYHFPVPEGPQTYFSKDSGYPRADHQVSSYDMTGGSSWIDRAFAIAEDNDWVLGGFIWTGIDYIGEPTPYQTWPSHTSYYGPIDLAGLPKDRFYLHRANWRKDVSTLHILPHWNWKGREGEVTPVFVYTSWPEVELFVNGVSQGRRRKDVKSLSDRYRLRWMNVKYEPGEVKAVAYDEGGSPVEEAVVRTAGEPARLIVEADRTVLKKLNPHDTPDLGYVTVKIVDKDGNLCPNAANLIEVKVTGAAKFRCLANGDSTCLESFVEPQMHAFSGQLVVTVEAGAEAGAAKLAVSAQGLPAASVDFEVKAEDIRPVRVALTFDDGSKGHLLLAAPMLEERGWRGTFNLVTDWIGTENHLTWDDVKELLRRGHEVTTHTKSHPNLVKVLEEQGVDAVRREWAKSREAIVRNAAFAPRYACMPFMQENEAIRTICREEGLEPFACSRRNFGTGDEEKVVPWLERCFASGIARVDALCHGVSACEGGGWRPFADRAAFAKYLDGIAALEKAGKVIVTDYAGMMSDCALKAKDWPRHGILTLSFDDHNLEKWEAALPIFAKYDAKAAFCVSGAIDDEVVAFARKAMSAGHELALHGLSHRNADTSLAEMGEAGYWAKEIEPQLSACRRAGLPVTSFAYPNGRRTDDTDRFFLARGFTKMRGSGGRYKSPNPHDPKGLKLDQWKPIATFDPVFDSAADQFNDPKVKMVIMGRYYHTDIDDILKAMARAGARGERLSIVSHDIAAEASGIGMRTEWLEKLLAAAKDAGVVVRGLR